MERNMLKESQEMVMPKTQAEVVGHLEIGTDAENRIKSQIENDAEASEYLDKVHQKLVKVDTANLKCAVCMDGRGCRCLASDIIDGVLPDAKKPPIRPEMAGGLVDMATMMALLGGWHGLSEVETYDEARSEVATFLADLDYIDGAHTSDISFQSPETTECGAWMKKDQAMQKGVAAWRQSEATNDPNALDGTVAALQGIETNIVENADYSFVRRRQAQLVEDGLFGTFDPVKTRDDLIAAAPAQVELLYSDPDHPTHNHKEPMLVVNEAEETTVDRDELYSEDGFAPFVDDRWLRRRLAHDLATSRQEEARLLIAGDITTVDVSDELIAPGMPVGIIKAA